MEPLRPQLSGTGFQLLMQLLSHPHGLGLLQALFSQQAPQAPATLPAPGTTDTLPMGSQAPVVALPRFPGDQGKGQDVPLGDVAKPAESMPRPPAGQQLPMEREAPKPAAPIPSVPMAPQLMDILRAMGRI